MSDAVASAVIAASIALIGLIVGKEGKTSEFRQQWIDGLRADVAILISSALHAPENSELYKSANESAARIRLRLNPHEKKSKALIAAMQTLRLCDGQHSPISGANEAANKVVETTQAILKEEWRRVKRGEWRYRTVLSLATACLVISASIMLRPWLAAFLMSHSRK